MCGVVGGGVGEIGCHGDAGSVGVVDDAGTDAADVSEGLCH